LTDGQSIIFAKGQGTPVNEVWAVEPGADMRALAQRLQAAFPMFHLVEGCAEKTGLRDASIDT
jgi:hypothetical protein